MFFYSIGRALFFGEFVVFVIDLLLLSKAASTEAFTVDFGSIGF